MVKQDHREVVMPTRSSKKVKKSNAGKRKRTSLESEGSNGLVELAFACKPLKVGIPKDAKKVNWQKTNLKCRTGFVQKKA
jgi:hypothetical protein